MLMKATHRTLAIALAGILASGAPARAQDPLEITPFKPFRIADNLYFVGTEGLGMFLVNTPQGSILVNTGYELNVRRLRASVEYLGFRFSDIRILLASHAHGDHIGGAAMVQRITGAKYMVMDADVPVVTSGGAKDFAYGADLTMRFPIARVDRVLRDGDTVRLGGAVLVAHRTAGHTKGATTWTMRVNDRGAMRDVLILSSPNVNEGYRLVDNAGYPSIAEDYQRAFRSLRGLPCDIFLAAHGSQFNLRAKYQRMIAGDTSAFIDPEGCRKWLTDREQVFNAELAKQQPKLAAQDSESFPERSARDLSGAWVYGSTDEPAVRRVVLRPPCNFTPSQWYLEQHGDSITWWSTTAHQAQGIATRTVAPPPRTVGRIIGSAITMTIDSKRYALVYDSVSGHLRGTVNGAPFWAVPQEVVRPKGCILPP
jgi:metallo-beta-lactamase class B